MSGNRPPGFMYTRHGSFDLFSGTPEIEDIAHALGMQCRFNGHTTHFYSVAQHCVNVSRLLKNTGWNEKAQLYGLLHDAGEAYTGDITVPVQRMADCTSIKLLEERIMIRVWRMADLGEPPHALANGVHVADQAMGQAEIRDLIQPEDGDFSECESIVEIRPAGCMRPEDAKDLFLYWYRHLQARRKTGVAV